MSELDFTIFKLNDSIQLHGNGKDLLLYKKYSQKDDVVRSNYLLCNVDKNDFINKKDIAESYYITSTKDIYVCKLTGYITKDIKSFSKNGVEMTNNKLICVL